MPALSEYVNVYGTALDVLQKKGFQVWHGEATDLFYCEKGGWDFAAENPIALLGLVAIFESFAPNRYSEYWWRADSPVDYRALARSSPNEYESVTARRGEE